MADKMKMVIVFFVSMLCFTAGIFVEDILFFPQAVQAAELPGDALEQDKSKSMQLDGKGAKEKIRYTMEHVKTGGQDDSDRPYYRHTLTLKINGSTVLEESITDIQPEAKGDVLITDIDKSDGLKDIFAAVYTKEYVSEYRVLYYCQYKNGKFTKVQDLGKYLYSGILDCFGKSYGNNCHVWYGGLQGSMRVSGNGKMQIMVCGNMNCASKDFGYFHGMFSLKLKNGKLRRADANPHGDIAETDFDGAELAAKCTFYKKPGSSEKAFTGKKGEIVAISGYQYAGKQLYFKVVNKNKKEGWFAAKNIFQGGGTLHA